ncbi:helix-turn-helix domain-containing protein [Streptomyces sp. NPDC003710]
MINAIHGFEGVGRVPAASTFQVAWDGEQRKVLEELARSRTAPLRRVQRARAALACADGGANAAIARALGVHVDTVRRWRKRFAADGLAALEDRPRPGRSPRYGPDVHLAIVATVTSARPATNSHWTRRAIAHRLNAGPGWQHTRGSPSTTHPNTPRGSTKSRSSSRSWPADCRGAVGSPRARTSSTRSARSLSPTTMRPDRSAGPTTEPRSKPHGPRKINALLH